MVQGGVLLQTIVNVCKLSGINQHIFNSFPSSFYGLIGGSGKVLGSGPSGARAFSVCSYVSPRLNGSLLLLRLPPTVQKHVLANS